MKIPACCGKSMEINMELSRFMEVRCSKCGDIVYIKKESAAASPKMIDD